MSVDENGSVVATSLQKEVSQILDGRVGSVDVGSSNTIKEVNESLQNAELIQLNANPTFLDNNASFSINTGTNSNFVTNPSPLNLQVSAPLVATSQPSVCAAPTNQVMTVMLPGTNGPVQQAAAHSNHVMTVMLPDTTDLVQQASAHSNQVMTVMLPDTTDPVQQAAAHSNQVMTVMLPGTTGPVKQAAAHSNQVMTVMLPGTTGPVQQAAARSGIPLYPPYEKAAPHLLATNSSSQVVATTIPGPQNVNSAVKDHMSTVTMCGNDDVIPQFITIQHPDSCEYVGVVILNCLLLNDLVKTMCKIKSV